MKEEVKIHPTAVVSKEAEFAPGVEIGPYSVIEGQVIIGPDCKIGSHVIIRGPVIMGKNNRIYSFAVIGEDPQHLQKPRKGGVVIGENNVFRESVTVHASTEEENTVIGNGNYFMVGCHIAHDCKIGNCNIMANWAGLAGHVEVGDYNFISGHSGIHQFARVGSYCMVGGGAMVPKDVAPFTIVTGDRARFRGLNVEGLRRAGFSPEDIKVARDIVRIFFREKRMVREALEEIKRRFGGHPLAELFVGFVKTSKRGVVK